MNTLEISEQHLAQLERECELDNIDTTRLHWGIKGDVYTVHHDKPLVDLGSETPESLAATGSALAVQIRGHWLALRIQRAERRKVRVGRVCMTMNDICRVPLDPKELAAFREHLRSVKRIEELSERLAAARSAKAARETAAAELAGMKSKYRLEPALETVLAEEAPEDAPTFAGSRGISRGSGRPRKPTSTVQQKEQDHVSQ